MQFVEIYKLKTGGEQEVIARCEIGDGGIVKCLGDKIFVSNLEKEGIFEYSESGRSETKLFPKDGLKFLEQLSYNFKSGYLNASDIKNI
ncbi:MAG: hypothetical protein A3I24_04460 [Candidatus Harrisonbacteria bacterium RIFCSPLOWO2_02_FULL_41_13b]|uniref:Uncharacterized protein n=1 Tax=Candidatus Harrisonbacteria bacterium RIFCSPLOWO2_02_FULL_41_13b TaxID=1798409 RepID=A0A1G1ZQ51_9BACT|nr:MAG: hypothetical protein A3J53_02690 [Candidatus Harrisonbacteria bacterium RIFCSPHIGHO2_02_FULL_40_20]OGY66744.1 MAG: hypothetical protein A3I24_04460 [Candidatus Harrisonbacteria bacterium RIFCSPLOWO2_02_FULL_41_13b]